MRGRGRHLLHHGLEGLAITVLVLTGVRQSVFDAVLFVAYFGIEFVEQLTGVK